MAAEPQPAAPAGRREFDHSMGEQVAYFLPALALAFSLSITWLSWNTAREDTEQEAREYFDFRVRDVMERTEHRLMTYQAVLHGTQGLFEGSSDVQRDEFRKYVAALRLAEELPGIQGVGFALSIPPRQKARHIAAMRKHGFPAYDIKPEGKRNLYTSIIYLEPFAERNLRAFGYDMYSEPVRREAMERARDSGEIAMSGKVVLVQETGRDVQAGFLMYLPVYRNDRPHGTVAERRANLIGWAYEPFRIADFMHGIYGERALDLDVHIYDGDNTAERELMYDSSLESSGDNLHSPRFAATQRLEMASHTWTLLISSRPPFESRISTARPRLIAAGGIVASVLLALVIWMLASGRRRALRLAQAMNRNLIASERQLRNSEQRYRTLTETMKDVVWVLDVETMRFIYVSPSVTLLRGYTPEEILAQPIDASVTPQAASRVRELIRKRAAAALQAGSTGTEYYTDEVEQPCKDGSTVWTEVIMHFLRNEKTGQIEAHGVARDISERKRAEKALQDSRTILQSILDNLPYLVWLKDVAGKFIVVNKPFLATTGKSRAEDVLGKTDADLWPAPLAERYRRDDEQVISLRQQVTHEEEALDKGRMTWIETFKAPVFDAENQLLGITGFARDITERKLDELRVRHQAHHDALTGLPNRILFSDLLQQALAHAKRAGEQLAVLYLDLDQFKPVNDTFGHDIGDLLLKEVAQRLLRCVRESDTVARIGGDEFCILLPGIASPQDAAVVAEKILNALRLPFELRNVTVGIAASVGIAIYPQDGREENTLVKSADIAMYWAKEAGRNTMKFFQPEMRRTDLPLERPV